MAVADRRRDARISREPARGDRHRVPHELIERFQLDAAKKVRALSKGNRQKIQLVAAFATRADLLILDEPTSGLDPLMEQAFRDAVVEANSAGRPSSCRRTSSARWRRSAIGSGSCVEGRLVDEGTLDELRHLSAQTLEVTFTGPRPGIRQLPGIESEAVDAEHVAIRGERVAARTARRAGKSTPWRR